MDHRVQLGFQLPVHLVLVGLADLQEYRLLGLLGHQGHQGLRELARQDRMDQQEQAVLAHLAHPDLVVPQVLPILGKEHGQPLQLILSTTVLRMMAVVMCAYLLIHQETQTMSQEQVLLGRHIGTC